MAKVPPRSGKGPPPVTSNTMGNLDKPEAEELVALNFKVAKPIKKDFKIIAAALDMDMVELFYECFAAFKRERTK